MTAAADPVPSSSKQFFKRRPKSSHELTLSPNDCDPTLIVRAAKPGRRINPWKHEARFEEPVVKRTMPAEQSSSESVASALRCHAKGSPARPLKLVLRCEWILITGCVGCGALRYLRALERYVFASMYLEGIFNCTANRKTPRCRTSLWETVGFMIENCSHNVYSEVVRAGGERIFVDGGTLDEIINFIRDVVLDIAETWKTKDNHLVVIEGFPWDQRSALVFENYFGAPCQVLGIELLPGQRVNVEQALRSCDLEEAQTDTGAILRKHTPSLNNTHVISGHDFRQAYEGFEQLKALYTNAGLYTSIPAGRGTLFCLDSLKNGIRRFSTPAGLKTSYDKPWKLG